MAKKDKPLAEMTQAERKEARQAKRKGRINTIKQVWTAFNMQRKEDKWLLPIMIAVLVAVLLVVVLVTYFFMNGSWVTWLFMVIAGILLGVMLDMVIFTRRMTNSLYAKADGQPGMAGWVLSQLKGTWRVQQTVAGNTTLDVVHRVVGRPGVILVGEGNHARLRGLMQGEKRKLARVVGDTPIYEIYVGHGEDEVEMKKLERTIKRLPKNIDRDKVDFIQHRLESLAAKSGMMGMPKGPIPAGAKVRNVQRSARRRTQR